MFIIDDDIEAYAFSHTSTEPPLLLELAEETKRNTSMPQMLTGRIEGRFLKLLVQLTRAKTVLEVGMFTGYSALSMAEGLPADGRLITCEIEPKYIEIAKRYFAKSPYGEKIEIKQGAALDTLKLLDLKLDLAFLDADKENYSNYYEHLIKLLNPGGLLIVDNTLWSGRVLKPEDQESKAIDRLNKLVQDDSRVEHVLLTVRDGMNIIRKK